MKISPFFAAALALALAACSSNPKSGDDSKDEPRDTTKPSVFNDPGDPLAKRRKDRRDESLSAEQFYLRGRRALESSDFGAAVEAYDELSTRFPFSDYATQGELDRVYALYRSYEPDRAFTSADRFLREHPRHPAVDYIHYLKGLINYSRDEAELAILPSDESKSDVSSLRRAFDDFALLVQRYPGSRYAGDAYSRMVFIRNRLAAHELHVVDFYVRRGAYVAAAKRGEQVIAQYPGTPASYRALELLVESYERAGLEQQATDARKLLAAQTMPAGISGNQGRALEVVKAPAREEKPGMLSRFAGFFSPFDSSKEDAGLEIVIPSAKPKAEVPSAATETGGTQTTAGTPPAAEAKPNPNRLEVFFEPYDEAPAPANKAPPDPTPPVPENAP